MTSPRTGVTTWQMLTAPKGASYVWCNGKLPYPQALAKALERDDLVIRPLDWLRLDNVPNPSLVAVVVDHAAQPGPEAREAIRWLGKRGVLA